MQEKDVNVLDDCLEEIKNSKLREWAEDWINNKVPNYIFEVPASSTGKYHPKFSLGKGGLIRHTRAAFKIALTLIDNGVWKFDESDRDKILTAILLHDCLKHSKEKKKYSVAEHPSLMAEEIRKECAEGSTRDDVAALIETHMGRWCEDYRSGEKVNPEPDNIRQFFVHLCDYLASRRFMDIDVSDMVV